MERMSCPTRGCGAVYPDHARFCPRCGNANPRVMSTFDRSRAPRVERVQDWGSRRSKQERFRRAFRCVVPLVIVGAMMSGKLNSHHRSASAQSPASVAANPSWYHPLSSEYRSNQSPPAYIRTPPPVADVSTLIAFETQQSIGFVSDQSREQWRQQLVGQRIHWAGYVFTPRDGIGGPALASSMDRPAPGIHLQTASREAKNRLHTIPEGSKVQVDGVLMDDHWIHVIDVSRLR